MLDAASVYTLYRRILKFRNREGKNSTGTTLHVKEEGEGFSLVKEKVLSSTSSPRRKMGWTFTMNRYGPSSHALATAPMSCHRQIIIPDYYSNIITPDWGSLIGGPEMLIPMNYPKIGISQSSIKITSPDAYRFIHPYQSLVGGIALRGKKWKTYKTGCTLQCSISNYYLVNV